MEDLKERYYCICGKLTKVRAASGAEPKIYIFDAGHERRRKEQLEKLFSRTPEQVSGTLYQWRPPHSPFFLVNSVLLLADMRFLSQWKATGFDAHRLKPTFFEQDVRPPYLLPND